MIKRGFVFFLVVLILIPVMAGCGGGKPVESNNIDNIIRDTEDEVLESSSKEIKIGDSVNVDGETFIIEELEWYDFEFAKVLPKPTSNIGIIIQDDLEQFMVGILDVSKKQYDDYIEECQKKGLVMFFDSELNTYSLYDERDVVNGQIEYLLCLTFYSEDELSFMIIFQKKEEGETLNINRFKENMFSASQSQDQPQPSSPTTVDWKTFLAEYEAWMDEYVALMKKYKANPTDFSIMSDYFRMLEELAEWTEKADKIEGDLSDDPEALKEYLAVQLRIIQKLNSVL